MIRRIIQLAALLSLGIFIGSLSAQQTTGAVNLFCQDGNVKASTQGAPSTNTLQGSYPKCTVTVYLTGTTTHATIYKDSSSTPLANPFTANADGSFVFFAASKAGYDVVTSAGIPITFPQAFTYTDIWIANDGGGGGTSLCGPLDGDATSTNCGNGNFTSYTGTTGQAYGFDNLDNVTGGFDHIGIGESNLHNVTSSSTDIIGIGDGTADNLNAANDVVAIGDGAGTHNITFGGTINPSDLVAIGDGAGAEFSGSEGVFLGATGGWWLHGANNIIGIGNGSGTGPRSATGPTNSTAANLIGIGNSSVLFSAGSDVIGIGDFALSCTLHCFGGGTSAGNTGVDNIAIGDHALAANTTGTDNIAIGKYVGANGWTQAGTADPVIQNSNQTGSQNTWIGDTSGPISTTQLSNTVALGYGANPTVSNQTVIGNNSITAVTIYGVGTGCLSASSGVITGSGSACGSGGGGGSNVTVNGGSTLTTANFGTLPAAGSNGLNVTWQNSGNNVSAEIVGDGVSTHFLNGNGGWTAPAGGGSGTVTSIATTGPITGGTITTSGTIACATCVVASSPGVGIAHFAGSTQTVTSSAVNLASADVTGLLPHANIAATAVTPGSYTNANITVAADGSITTATNGSGGSGLPCSGTCTAGKMALFGASGTSITNSHLDETTNAGEDTFSQPVVAPSYTSTGATNGAYNFTSVGTPSAAPTGNTVQLTVPNSGITAYALELPPVAPSGSLTSLNCTPANPSICSWAAGGSASTPNTTVASSGTSQALTFATAGDKAYEVTLSANCTFTITDSGSTGTLRKLTLIVHPATFSSTLPASSGSFGWNGGSVPTLSTSVDSIIVFESTGAGKIYGGVTF